MKKAIAILLVALMALSVVACANKKDEVKEANYTEKIVGTWELTDYQGTDELGEMMKGYAFEFRKDGTYSIGGMDAGTYKVEGEKLYFNGDTDEYYKITFSGNTMKIAGQEDTMTFTKK